MSKKPIAQPHIPRGRKFKKTFRLVAEKTSNYTGSPHCFCLAIFLFIVWGVSGFYFNFSDTWQLMINTATTIGTFLMVILIQNTQNRDAKSIHIKLDELVRGIKETRNSLIAIEEQSDEEIDELKYEFKKLREEYILELKQKEPPPPSEE